VLMGRGWPCSAAAMGRGVLGGGMIMPLWHGVTMLSLWLDTAGLYKEASLSLFFGFCVWNMFGGWKLGQEGSLSFDTT